MSRLGARDRLQPSLLDRLIDLEPRERSEPPEARALSRQQLRQAVLRDLAWLFNAVSIQSNPAGDHRLTRDDWKRNPEAAASVVNYGLPSLTGQAQSSIAVGGLRADIVRAIRNFEPRLDPGTLEVDVRPNPGNLHNNLQILIRGKMWAQPMPLELMLSADMDVETGVTRIRDLRS